MAKAVWWSDQIEKSWALVKYLYKYKVCCCFFQGYVPRQALYACATCDPENLAGVCLACSLECHEGHELFELYTKRFYSKLSSYSINFQLLFITPTRALTPLKLGPKIGPIPNGRKVCIFPIRKFRVPT